MGNVEDCRRGLSASFSHASAVSLLSRCHNFSMMDLKLCKASCSWSSGVSVVGLASLILTYVRYLHDTSLSFLLTESRYGLIMVVWRGLERNMVGLSLVCRIFTMVPDGVEGALAG